MRLGEEDGFGFYGVLDESDEGLLCHECGGRFTHLGLHVWKRHGISARAYRQAHGLGARGLVAESTRDKQKANASRTMGKRPLFVQRRDPQAATAASGPMSPAGRESMREALEERKGKARQGTVITCQWCGARFCPMRGASRRGFCSRSCASRFNRRARRA